MATTLNFNLFLNFKSEISKFQVAFRESLVEKESEKVPNVNENFNLLKFRNSYKQVFLGLSQNI